MKRKKRRIKSKKPFWKKKLFWLFVFIFLVFDGFFYLFIFSEIFQIKEIKITGNDRVASETLEQIIKSGIDKKIVFPTKAIFLADLEKIENEIQDKFPEIKRVQLKRKFPNTLILVVEARNSFMVLCQNETNCFKVDEEGFVFERTEKGVEFSVFVPEKQIVLGEQVIAGDCLASIKQIQKSLQQDLKIEAKEFWFLEDRFNVKTSDGYELYFDLKTDVLGQIFNLSQLLKEKVSLQELEKLEYIDLRFGNRVYFR